MEIVLRTEVENHPQRWVNTSGVRSDGKEEYREIKEYGNRHVIFKNGALYGTTHHDKHNATDFPVGTVQHISKYTEEKTGIPAGLVTIGIVATTVAVSAFLGYKAIKYVAKKI